MQQIIVPFFRCIWHGDTSYTLIFRLEFTGSFAAGKMLGKCAECGNMTTHRGSFLGPVPHFFCIPYQSFGLIGEDKKLTAKGIERFTRYE